MGTPKVQKGWIPATPSYYAGTVFGFLVFALPLAFILVGLGWALFGFVPQALTHPDPWLRMGYFGMSLLVFLGIVVTAISLGISFVSCADRLWVTPEVRDRRLAIHRAWYDACVAVDPELDHPELWPPRPY